MGWKREEGKEVGSREEGGEKDKGRRRDRKEYERGLLTQRSS